MNGFLEAALRYAGLGWPVFPLEGKEPRTANGVKDATTDEDQIRKWWGRWPDANIGVACGEKSAVVLDFDGPGAFEGLKGFGLATTAARTRRGQHLYFKWSEGCEKLRNWTGVIPGLDIRTEGGYVVVPPSIHPESGLAYEWIVSPGELKAFPQDLIAVLVEARRKKNAAKLNDIETASRKRRAAKDRDGATRFASYAAKALEEEGAAVRAAREGSRNSQLNESAFSLFGLVKAGVLDEDEVRCELERAAGHAGLPDDEVSRTLDSAWNGAVERDLPEDGRRREVDEEVPEDVKARALEILERGDPIEYVMSQFRRFHVGDDKLAKVLLASVISGMIKNSKGIQPKPSGRSGAGKTHACKSMAHCTPEGLIIEASVSAKSLYYLKRLEPGCIIFSDDVVMSDDLEGTFKRSMTNFQQGTTHITLSRNREVLELELPERLTWWLTSVHNNYSDELLNRMFGLNVEEGKEADDAVFEHEKKSATSADEELPADEGVLVAREIIRRIRQNVYLVAVPFAERIMMADVSDRRNIGRLLDLIRAAAVIRVLQRATRIRDDGIVEVYATEEDFGFAEELFEDRASNLIYKVNDTEDELLKFIAQRGPVAASEIVRDFKLPDGRGLSKGYLYTLLHGRKDRGGKGLLDHITGLDCKNEAVRTDEGKTTYQNVYVLHSVYNQWDQLNKAVWLEPERVCHGFATGLPPTTTEEPIAVERITKNGLSGLPGLPPKNGAKKNSVLDSSSGLSGQTRGKPGKPDKPVSPDSDSSGKPDAKPVANPTSRLVELARRNGGRVSLEDCMRAGIDRDKAVFLLGMYGWERSELVSGLTIWRPPEGVRP